MARKFDLTSLATPSCANTILAGSESASSPEKARLQKDETKLHPSRIGSRGSAFVPLRRTKLGGLLSDVRRAAFCGRLSAVNGARSGMHTAHNLLRVLAKDRISSAPLK